MEEALKKLLKSGAIGEKLLNPESQHLLLEVENLKKKSDEAKEELQKASALKATQEKDLTYMNHMLGVIQGLTTTYKNDLEVGLLHNKDMSAQLEGHLRHQNLQTESIGQFELNIERMESQIISKERETEDIQKGMEVDSALLQELLDHLTAKEEDHLLLLQFTAAEASEMKLMSVDLEKLSSEVAEAERRYRECHNETLSRKTVRTQLVNFFLKEAERRDELLVQWEETLEELKSKMSEETAVIEDILRVQNKITSQRLLRDRESELLSQVEASVREIEAILTESERESTNLALEYSSVLEASQEVKSQIAQYEVCRDRLSSEIGLVKSEMESTKDLWKEKSVFLSKMEQKNSKHKTDLALETQVLFSSEQSLHALETIRKECEQQRILLEKQIGLIRNLRQRHLQEEELLEEEKRKTAGEGKASLAINTRTLNDIKCVKENSAKNEQIIYSQDLEMLELKSRIQRLSRDDNNNLSEEQKESLISMKETLNETTKDIAVLGRTLSILQTQKMCCENVKNEKEREVTQLEEEVTSLSQICENIDRERWSIQREKEELLVDVSLTQVNFQNRLRELEEIRFSNTHILEQRMEMEKLLKEECESINGAIAASKTQIRDLEVRQSVLTKKLHSLHRKTQQIIDKYNRIKEMVNIPEDEEEISPLYVMLEIAKEREVLQEAGDVLDNEVRKAEDEVEALRKILALLNMECGQFRSQLFHITHHNEDDSERIEIENNLNSLEDNIKIWNELYKNESTEFTNTREKVHEMELQLHAVEDLLREKNVHIREADKELGSQQLKARHVALAVSSLKIKLNSRISKLADVELRVLQERLKVVNTILGQVVMSHPEIATDCVVYCQQENLPPPKFQRLPIKSSDHGSRTSLESLESSKGSSKTEEEEDEISSATPSDKLRPHSSLTSLLSHDSGGSSIPLTQDARIRSAPTKTTRGSKVSFKKRKSSKPSVDAKGGSKKPDHVEEAAQDGADSRSKKRSKKSPKNVKEPRPGITSPKMENLNLIFPDFPKRSTERSDARGKRVLKKPSFRI